jgi:putative SOS response-associated peptidase YedK
VCGRYTLTSTEGLQLRFELVEGSETRLSPRFNVAPSQGVPVVVESGRGRVLRAVRWGFQPLWVREDVRRPPPINARAETLATSGLFRDALAKRRCLIVADGFYEWRAVPGEKEKRPMRFRLATGGVFAFAGLFTGPRDRQAEDGTCAIVTVPPNALVAPVHNRMPAILAPEDEALWLDPEVRDPVGALSCLRPYPAELMACEPVDPRVGSPLVDEPSLLVAPGAATG